MCSYRSSILAFLLSSCYVRRSVGQTPRGIVDNLRLRNVVLECPPGRPVYFLISTLGRSSQSTVKSSLLCPGRLDFIFSVNFYIFGHLDPSFLAPG
jgi:hypothetical protein